MNGAIHCPSYNDIRLKACPLPPNKNILQNKLRKIEKERNMNLGLSETSSPDKALMVAVLSTFSPSDEIFNKDYLPPINPKKKIAFKTIEIP